MKVFSICYTTNSLPGHIAMGTAIAKDFQAANAICLKELISTKGDMGWTPNVFSFNDVAKVPETEVVDNSKLTKNWLIKTIINNKDKKLFSVSKKYLSGNENNFIKEKLLCKQ